MMGFMFNSLHYIRVLLALWIFAIAVAGDSIKPRAATPSPISITPSSQWIGNDGPWSSFEVRIGSNQQDVGVLVSTAGSETWVVWEDGGCQAGNSPSTCPTDRGGLVNISQSSTWTNHSSDLLGLEQNLGLNEPWDDGWFGFDTVGLAWQGQNGPTLDNQTIALYDTTDFFTGIFGISPYSTNFTGYNTDQSVPTFFTNLRTNNSIPSLTWAYTAGAQYRNKGVLASLVFGGYDSARLYPSNTTFQMGSNNNRDLLIGIEGMTYSQGSNTTSLMAGSSGVYAFIDSTVAELWLPLDVCQAFESAFNLTWDDASQLYLVSDDLHNTLMSQNASVTLQLADNVGLGASSQNTVNITLPYDSFDLTASWPLVNSSSNYFPLKRAANDSQYTLGRTFLQEAYVIADYDHWNFSISPCRWDTASSSTLVAITTDGTGSAGGTSLATSTSSSSSKHGLSGGAIAGIVVGVLLGLGLLAGLLLLFLRRRRRERAENRESQEPVLLDGAPIEKHAIQPPSHTELDSAVVYELEAGDRPQLLESSSVGDSSDSRPAGQGNDTSTDDESPPSAPSVNGSTNTEDEDSGGNSTSVSSRYSYDDYAQNGGNGSGSVGSPVSPIGSRDGWNSYGGNNGNNKRASTLTAPSPLTPTVPQLSATGGWGRVGVDDGGRLPSAEEGYSSSGSVPPSPTTSRRGSNGHNGNGGSNGAGAVWNRVGEQRARRQSEAQTQGLGLEEVPEDREREMRAEGIVTPETAAAVLSQSQETRKEAGRENEVHVQDFTQPAPTRENHGPGRGGLSVVGSLPPMK